MRYFRLLFPILILACSSAFYALSGPPLVYSVENSGIGCPQWRVVQPAELPPHPLLPDPFAWANGSGRIGSFSDWACRRNEIKAQIEAYEIGTKPPRPDNVRASLTNNTLTVSITHNSQTLTLTSVVVIPPGDGPFPVVIGMNRGTGSLPASLFEGVIQIPFMHNQVVTSSHQGIRDDNAPYFKLYPHLTHIGYYSAWSWGISRLIDGIELVKEQLKADTKHIAVTGCSYAGKMALFAGAFDERIALTLVQESGGGGINAWRVSETLGNIEKLGNTNYSWFMPNLKTHFDGRVDALPYDHHQLMAMVAPRALLVLGNPPWVWLGDESGYVSARAAERVFTKFGIEDRFGFIFKPAPNHCILPQESYPHVKAFIDKFLFDDKNAQTTIRIHDFDQVIYEKWMGW